MSKPTIPPLFWELGVTLDEPPGPAIELTLRDLFAAAALGGMCGHPGLRGKFEDYATDAFKYADAMLREREAKPDDD